MSPRRCAPRSLAAAMLGGLAALCALSLAACGNTLQDQPVPHNALESMMLAPYPVYWLGGTFHGLAITEASRDPGGALTLGYGDCLTGGQSTCVPPLKVVTSPDNGFVPGEGAGAGADRGTSVILRGARAYVAEGGLAIAIATGTVVLDVYAQTPALARAAAASAVPINAPGAPGGPLAARVPNTGFGERPLPSQIPNPLRTLR